MQCLALQKLISDKKVPFSYHLDYRKKRTKEEKENENRRACAMKHERKITNQFIFSANAIAFSLERCIATIFTENTMCIRGRWKGTKTMLLPLRCL